MMDLANILVMEIQKAAMAAGIRASVERSSGTLIVRISGMDVAKAIKEGIEPQYRQMVEVEAGDIVIKIRVGL